MALGTLCIVVYFIHYVAQSIQPSNVVATVAGELEQTIERLYPERIGHGDEDKRPARPIDGELKSLRRGRSRRGDVSWLRRSARRQRTPQSCEERRRRHPPQCAARRFRRSRGDARLDQPGRSAARRSYETVCKRFLLENRRTPGRTSSARSTTSWRSQSAPYRRESTTPSRHSSASTALARRVSHSAQRGVPSPLRFDDDEQLRVVARPYTFHGVINAAFDQIRQYGATSAAVNVRLIEALDPRRRVDRPGRGPSGCTSSGRDDRRGRAKVVDSPGDIADVETRHQRSETMGGQPESDLLSVTTASNRRLSCRRSRLAPWRSGKRAAMTESATRALLRSTADRR